MVVVALVVDQLAAWVATERLAQLPTTGGFARLAREGYLYERMLYGHAVTDTAPGHASLYTGQTPSVSGIVANERPVAGKKVSFLADETTSLVGADGRTFGLGSSLRALRVATFADAFHAEHSTASIVSISIKDRGALFGGGRAPSASIWFDTQTDQFVTSTAFGTSLPRFAQTTTTARSQRLWTLANVDWVQAHAKTLDAQEGEGDLDGMGTIFPHEVKTPKAFRATPFADEAVIELALRTVTAHAVDRDLLLALSLSANDYIGHVFGPDSLEAWDGLYRLDTQIARLFAALDARFGSQGYSVVLSADHGVSPLPEARVERPCGSADVYQRPCDGLTRLLPHDIEQAMVQVAAAVLGEGSWIAGFADPYLWLTPAARALPAEKAASLDRALVGALEKLTGVDFAVRARGVKTCLAPRHQALACASMHPEQSGDIYVQVKEGAFFDAEYTPHRGTSHGSVGLYDRTVPLFVRAPGRVQPGRTAVPQTFTLFHQTLKQLVR